MSTTRTARPPIKLSPPGDQIATKAKTIRTEIAERSDMIQRLERQLEHLSLRESVAIGHEIEDEIARLRKQQDELSSRLWRVEVGLEDPVEVSQKAARKARADEQAKVEREAAKFAARIRASAEKPAGRAPDLEGVDEELFDAIGDFVRAEIKAALDPLIGVLKSIETKIGPGAPLRYAGVWQRALDYAAGQVVTHDGSAWVALRDVSAGAPPGSSPDAWQLMVKRGSAAPEQAR